jgi:tetratricopeptide (TPR) repeat protein
MPRGLRTALPLCLLLVMLPAPPAGAQDDLVSQARRLDLAGRQDDAIAAYTQALRRTPDSFDAQYGIARALDLAGRYAEARDHFARAIALASEGEKDQALRMMGVSYAFVHDSRAAAPYFQQVFDRRIKAGNFAGAAEVANELARVYLELGDLDAAGREYRTAFDTAARQPARSAADADLAALRLAHAQGRIAARRGHAAEARRQEAAVKALVDKGTNADQQVQYAYLVGYDAFYLKNYSKAITALRTADQTDPFILMLLARAYEQSGQPAQAREYYQKTLASTSHAVNNAFARPIARQKLEAARR